MNRTLVFILCVVVLCSSVSAFEFDNVKDFDSKIGAYGKITITNAFGLGEKLWEGTLNKNTDVCGSQCSAEKEIILYNRDSLIDAVKFETVYKSGGRKEESIISYQFYIQTSSKEIIVDDYDWVCTNKDDGNGSYRGCDWIKIGSHTETKTTWQEYTIGDEVDAGTYIVKLEGSKKPTRTVDWIIQYQGRWLDDWAVWGSQGQVLIENYTGGGNTNNVFDPRHYAQTFRVGETGTDGDYTTSNISLNLNKVGTPAGNIWVAIRAINTTGGPLLPDLANGSITTASVSDAGAQWYNFSVNASLSASTNYSIVMWIEAGDGSNLISWSIDTSSPTYTGGYHWTDEDDDDSWDDILTYDGDFKVYGKGGSITLNSPADAYSWSFRTLDFNCTATQSGATISNMSLWTNSSGTWEISNTTTGLSGGTNETVWNHTFAADGNILWTCQTCDSDGDCDYANNRTVIINNTGFTENSQTFNSVSSEGTLENFTISITHDSSRYTSLVGYLVYNGTSYTGTQVGTGNLVEFTRNLTMPIVGTQTNYSFYWLIAMTDGSGTTNFNSTVQNQTVNNIGLDDCGANPHLLLNLTLRDEGSQARIVAATYNTSIEVEIELYDSTGTTLIQNYSQNYSENNNPKVCLESDLGNSTFKLDALITYDGDAYAFEHYNIQKFTLINSSLPQNINLYDLLDTNSQEFKVTYKDENFLAVEDTLIQIQRKYPSDGVFKTVEIPKTDTKGETVAHLVVDDVIYTFIIVKNGATLATFSNVRAVCQNPTLEECEINLNSFASHLDPEDFTVLTDFTFTMTYNKTSRTVESVFTIPSGAVATILLNTTLIDQIGVTQVCSDSLTTSSGTLTCVVPTSFGNGSVIAKITKDGTLMGQAIISLEQEPSDIYGGNVVFIGLFLFLTLVGVGLGNNPMITGFFLIIGGILAVLLNVIDTGVSSFIGAGATILWLFIAIIIVLIKGAKRT